MDPVSTKAAAGRQVRYRMTVFTTLAYETATNAVIAQNVKDERVRELMEELRRRVTSGADDAQLIGLAMDLDRALKIRTGYKPFLQRVKDSPAFG